MELEHKLGKNNKYRRLVVHFALFLTRICLLRDPDVDRLIQPRFGSRTGKQKMAMGIPGSNFRINFRLNYGVLRAGKVFLLHFKEDGHVFHHITAHPDENTAPT